VAVLIGNDAAGAGSTTFFPDLGTCVTKYPCVASGTVSSMSTWSRTSGASLWLLIYADASGTPGALLGQTVAITSLPDEVTVSGAMAVNVPVTLGTDYWLGLFYDSAGGSFNSRWLASGGFRYRDVTGIQDPWDTSSNSTGTEGLAIQGDGTASSSAVGVPRSRPMIGR
jgi:hypothetical protein